MPTSPVFPDVARSWLATFEYDWNQSAFLSAIERLSRLADPATGHQFADAELHQKFTLAKIQRDPATVTSGEQAKEWLALLDK